MFYFALPELFSYSWPGAHDKIFNWPFINAFIGGALLTLLIALIVGRFWFHHRDVATLSMVGLTAGGGISDRDYRSYLRPMDRMGRCRQSFLSSALIIFFVGSSIAVLEGTRASSASPLHVASHLFSSRLRNPLVILLLLWHSFFDYRIPPS